MNKHRRKRSRHADSALAASGNAGLGQEPRPAWDRRSWLVAIPLALFVIAAFIPILNNGFVTWDDDKNFLDNPFYRGLGLAQVKWACSTFWVGVYQPLAWLLFGAQYVFWKLDPRGYHLTSLVFHAANAVVLYVLTVTLLVRCRPDSFLRSPWTCSVGAGLATALFMVHPLRVEAVAWASCQPYLPCAFFSMLAVLAYLWAFPRDSSRRWGWLVWSFVLFVAALLSKAVAVSLPAVLLILDVYPLRRLCNGPGPWFGSSARRALLEKVPFVMVSLVFMGLAVAAKPQTRVYFKHYDASARFAQACYAPWFYIEKTALPLDLTAYYPTPGDMNWLAPSFLLSIMGTLGMSALLVLLRRRWPGLLAVWLCYLVILAPNSGILRISDQLAADRYSYVAMLGCVILAAACLCGHWQTPSRARRGAIGTVALCLGAILVPMTWDQCRTWRDSESLWTHALNHGPGDNYAAHNNLGVVFFHQGKHEAAAAHYLEALRLDPGCAGAHINLAAVLHGQGKYEAAAAHYLEALRLTPGSADAHKNLGLLRYHQGRSDDAAAHCAEAVRLKPDSANAQNNLALVLFSQGKFQEAVAHYDLALSLDPGYADAHNNRAMMMAACPEAKYRDGKRAVESATRACELTDWKSAACLDTLAAAHAEAGNFDAAISSQMRALEVLKDERQRADFRSRLVLYQAKKPYREALPARPRSTSSH